MRHKTFWLGFLIAYGLAFFLPPSRVLSMGKKKG